MATVTKFGPADHGRPVTEEEVERGEFEPGHKYEVIDGRLRVSPVPNFPEAWLNTRLHRRLDRSSEARPDVCNSVTPRAGVFVPGRAEVTAPEPDLAVYHDAPLDRPAREINWRQLSTFIVVEVLVDADPETDSERDVGLYFEVPSVREYWVVDGRADPDRPALVVRRRHGGRWVVREYPFGAAYAPRCLPGFTLTVDPRA